MNTPKNESFSIGLSELILTCSSAAVEMQLFGLQQPFFISKTIYKQLLRLDLTEECSPSDCELQVEQRHIEKTTEQKQAELNLNTKHSFVTLCMFSHNTLTSNSSVKQQLAGQSGPPIAKTERVIRPKLNRFIAGTTLQEEEMFASLNSS